MYTFIKSFRGQLRDIDTAIDKLNAIPPNIRDAEDVDKATLRHVIEKLQYLNKELEHTYSIGLRPSA